MSRPDLASLILGRLVDGNAHDDAYQLVTVAKDATYDDGMAMAQAEILADHCRAAAAAMYLSSVAATIIDNYAEALGYDPDALLTGLAVVRPPFVA